MKMKKLYTILAILVVLATACQAAGTTTQPQEPTAVQPAPIIEATIPATPTEVPMNPTAAPQSGGTPDQGTEKVSTVDGMIQVYIPEGTFTRGGLDAAADNNENPVTKVTLHGFWMDKLEVTNGMYLLCVQAGACALPHYADEYGDRPVSKSETRPSYFRNPEFNDYPVVYVGWGDADAYCKWAGRRLPTEAEWEYSARGDFPSMNTYPWGDQTPNSTYANYNYSGDTMRVGSFPLGASPFGILDMAGNVAEWVHDLYDAKYYSADTTVNPQGPLAFSNTFVRVIRGGSWADTWQNIRVSKRSSTVGPNPNLPTSADKYFQRFYGLSASTIGFRCSSDN
jgi:formylglycine-generating enzyme required for sulfatase activity